MKENNLNKVVCGAIKNSLRDSDRQRKTHFGLARSGRSVVDEWPVDLAVCATEDPDTEDELDLDRKRKIIMNQIRECLNNPNHVELVERHLFQGERVSELARQLGIKSGTASSVYTEPRSIWV